MSIIQEKVQPQPELMQPELMQQEVILQQKAAQPHLKITIRRIRMIKIIQLLKGRRITPLNRQVQKLKQILQKKQLIPSKVKPQVQKVRISHQVTRIQEHHLAEVVHLKVQEALVEAAVPAQEQLRHLQIVPQ